METDQNKNKWRQKREQNGFEKKGAEEEEKNYVKRGKNNMEKLKNRTKKKQMRRHSKDTKQTYIGRIYGTHHGDNCSRITWKIVSKIQNSN